MLNRLPFQSEPFPPPEDMKRSFGRAAFAPYGNMVNGIIGPHHGPTNGPFRESLAPKYTPPTALDVFGTQEPPRPFEFNQQPSRDFIVNKTAPPHHTGFHTGNPSHHSSSINGPHHGHRDEEISTIFVVGFPDDMQEREFQNMFTFAKGFEAASLKIPHKDPTSSSHQHSFMPPSDPFNVISPTSVSGEGMGSNWPMTPQDDAYGHPSNHLNPPRKQIIGFAKFRTRAEAQEAKDWLQGRKVDNERGALLKAEMAKKNLHTKRGPGPSGLPLSMIGAGGMVGQDSLASLTGLPGGAAGLPTQTSGEAMRDRERELGALGAMGFMGATGQRQRERDMTDKESLGREQSVAPSARLRYGATEPDAESVEPNYNLRAHNQMAFDAFHAVPAPIQSRSASLLNNRNLLSPTESFSSTASKEANGFPLHLNGNPSNPWSVPNGVNLSSTSSTSASTSSRNSSPSTDVAAFSSSMSGFSLSGSPPGSTVGNTVTPVSAVHPHAIAHDHMSIKQSSHPPSSASSAHGAEEDNDTTLSKGINTPPNVANIDTGLSESPPEFISPHGRMNSSDQNPPINTLYVGNLPNSPPPPGYPAGHLEDTLRALFQLCVGYRQLCFRQKENGPMCFVEFDDVSNATKALNDLYGHQLQGLVKTGIRLSYSKNPLGVRPGVTQPRTNGFHPSIAWSNPSINNIYSPVQELPTSGHRLSETSLPQRHVHHRDSVTSNGDNNPSPVSAQFPFAPQQQNRNRFYSPPVLPNMYNPNHLPKLASGYRGTQNFAPFQPDSTLTPIPRNHDMHPIAPSPSIESARAG